MNILIKLTCLIGLVIAPILGGHSVSENHSSVTDEVQVEVNATSIDDADNITAEVKIITNKDGVQTKVSSVIKGSESYVNQTVKDLVAEAREN